MNKLGVIDEYLNGHSESVLVQFDLAAYVNYRKDLYCTYSKVDDFIAGAISPAWVLVDSTRSDQNVSDISTQSLLNHLRAHSSYKIVYQADDLFVFNKTIL